MPTPSDKLTERGELNVVLTDNPHSTSECIFHPAEATDKELEKMWIRATEDGYTSLLEVR